MGKGRSTGNDRTIGCSDNVHGIVHFQESVRTGFSADLLISGPTNALDLADVVSHDLADSTLVAGLDAATMSRCSRATASNSPRSMI